MTKKTRILISCVLVVVAFAAGVLTYAGTYANRTAQADGGGGAYFVDASGKIAVPAGGTSLAAKQSRGTEDNPFFVLEIVPYEGIAEFGYHIAGCEPIDMVQACWKGEYMPGEGTLFTTTTSTRRIWTTEEIPDYFPTTQMETHQTQYGVMKYVGDGTGNYNQTNQQYVYEDAPADYTGTRYKENGDGTYTVDAAGTKLRRTKEADYVAAADGDYLWLPLSADECVTFTYEEGLVYKNAYHDPGEDGTFKMFFENVPCYVAYNVKTIHHKNLFLRESIGLAYKMVDGVRTALSEAEIEERIANYHAVVYTVTPEDLNMNLDLIDRADLISISSKSKMGETKVITMYETYGRADLFKHLDSRKLNVKGATFATNPLDWEAALRIYSNATNEERRCPVIFDTNAYSSVTNDDAKAVTLLQTFGDGSTNTMTGKTGTQNNLYKLFLLLYQMPQTTFQSLYGAPDDPSNGNFSVTNLVKEGGTPITKKDGTPLTTGVFTQYPNTGSYKSARTYWNSFTLIPWQVMPDKTVGTNSTAYKPILDMLGIMEDSNGIYHFNSGGAQTYLRGGIYVFLTDNLMTTEFGSGTAVENDQYGEEVYDYFDSINGAEGEPDKVTTAQCLFYMLNGLEDGPYAIKNEDYKVLELQPAPVYKDASAAWTATSDAFWKPFIATYANTLGTVTVDRMTTSEFIGKRVECISEYDLIYIGINKLSENWTMSDSFLYAHTGPKVTLDTQYTAVLGWLGTGNNNIEKYFALSGNDLTAAAREKLSEYAASGAPLLFGTGFFTSTGASTVVDKIDRNSNVYALAEDDISTPLYEAALTDASTRVATETALRNALAKSGRVELEVLASPVLYDSSKSSDSDKYLSSNTLSYKFTVKAPAGTSYELALYVDTNGDGKFTPEERLNNVFIQKSGGSPVSDDKVSAGKTYTVSREVEDRIGAVAWKLDLVEIGAGAIENRTVYASLSGVSAIKAAEKEDLRVLQIVSKTADRRTVYLPQDDEVSGGTVTIKDTSASAAEKAVSQKFWDWTRNLNGLNITFTRMTEAEILAELTTDSAYLQKNYEMLILGFGDAYNGVSNAALITAIKNFIATGRAVLYTHDTSSIIGSGDASLTKNHSWGKNVTEAFRDMFGMDRYDVSLYQGAAGKTRADYPYLTTAYGSARGKLLTQDGYLLTQGMTNGLLYRYIQNSSGGNIESKTISRVNTGAITQYPYTIAETIHTATTHPQYYQLDLERDDIVVWYCLASDNPNGSSKIDKYYNATPNDVRNNYYIYNIGNITYSGMGHSGNLTDDEIKLFINTFVAAYRAVAKPVKVVVENDDATKNVGTGEYYLCVDVDSTDAAKIIGDADNDVYTSYRLQEADGSGFKEKDGAVTAMSKRVYFRINDTNTNGSGASYELKFSSDSAGAMAEIPLAVYKKSGNVFMDTKTVDTSFKASADNVYYVDVPIKLETDASGVQAVTTTELNIEVKMTYTVGSESFEVTGVTTVYITPRGLFDLD